MSNPEGVAAAMLDVILSEAKDLPTGRSCGPGETPRLRSG